MTTTTTTTQTVPITNGVHATSPAPTPSAASEIPRGSVTVPLNYFTPPSDGSAPYNYVEQPPEGVPQRNYTDKFFPTTIHDIRGQESSFTLDNNAFATISNVPSSEKDFTSDASIKQNYYPEVEKLLLERVPGANRVLLFDHTIRRAEPGAKRSPVNRVHIDQTSSSAIQRVHHHLPDEAETLLQSRYRIINVWRPLNGPVQSFPLAFADSSTVPDEDIVGVEHRYPDRTGETAGVLPNEKQVWHYWSGIDNEDRILLECYDSRNSKGRVPHSAFEDPRTPKGAKGRESIEVRALVFG
ncbi:hypothetical protein MMC20_002641 [Loxospora ochrophaea]|nr:hypothetical protein [Loxospora ochrophaea]